MLRHSSHWSHPSHSFLAQLSQLEVVLSFFEVDGCEFPKDLKGFDAKSGLVQTYPLPQMSAFQVEWVPLLWPSLFCIVIVVSRTAKITAIGASLSGCARGGGGEIGRASL